MAGNFFDQFDQTPASSGGNFFDQFDKVDEKKRTGGFGSALVEGAQATGRSVLAAGQALVGDNKGVEETAKAQTAAQDNSNAAALTSFKRDLAQRKQADDSGIWAGVKNVAGAAWENPTGAAQLVAEQLPNSAVVLAGGAAGLQAGAAAAPFLGPLAPLAPIAGGVLGMFLGNATIETGGKAIEKGADGFTPDERSAALKEGAVKGAVVTGVDAATLGASKLLFSPVGKAMESAGAGVLAQAGVNVADKAAVEAALKVPDIARQVQQAQAAAFKAANAGGKGAARVAGAAGLETAGEGLGEGLGEYAATGTYSPTEAVSEAFSSMGQSAAEVAYAKAKGQSKELLGKALPEAPVTPDPLDATNISYEKAVDTYLRGPTEAQTGAAVVSAGSVDEAIAAAEAAVGDIPSIAGEKGIAVPGLAGAPVDDSLTGISVPALAGKQAAAVAAAQAQLGINPGLPSAPDSRSAEQISADAAARRSDAGQRVISEMGESLPRFRYTPALQGNQEQAPAPIDRALSYVEQLRATPTPQAKAFVHLFDTGRVTRQDVQDLIDRQDQQAAAAVAPPAAPALPSNAAAPAPAGGLVVAEGSKPRGDRTVDGRLLTDGQVQGLQQAEARVGERVARGTQAPVEDANARLAAAAQAGDQQAMLRGAQIRDRGQVVASQMTEELSRGDKQRFRIAYENVAKRGGLATPGEAAVLDRMSPNERLYDQVAGSPAALKTATAPGLLPTAEQQGKAEARADLTAQRMGLAPAAPEGTSAPLVVAPAPAPRATAAERLNAAAVAAGQERGADRMSQQERMAKSAQAAADAKTAEQSIPAPRPSPAPDAVIGALKTIPALRSAEQKATIDAARGTMTPEQMGILEKAARGPFALDATERNALQAMRGGMKASGKRTTAQRLEALTESESAKTGKAVTVTEVKPEALPERRAAGAGELSKQLYQTIKQTARIFGKKVVIVESNDPGFHDGFIYDDDPSTIYINRRAEKPHLVIFGHELMHALKRDNPAAYEAIAKVIKVKEGVDLDKVAGVNGDMEELISDLQGNRFAEPSFWAEVFREVAGDSPAGKSAVMKLAAAAMKAVNKVMKAIGRPQGFEADQLVEDLNGVKAAIQKALATYAKSRYADAAAMDRAERGQVPVAQGESAQAKVATDRAVATNSPSAVGDKDSVSAVGDRRLPERVGPPTKAQMAARRAREEMGVLPSAKRVTETEAFKKWFGNSKVVDKNGEPRVVYHGTKGDIESFDPARLGKATGAKSAEMGFFFADDPRVSQTYAFMMDVVFNSDGTIGKKYAPLENATASVVKTAQELRRELEANGDSPMARELRKTLAMDQEWVDHMARGKSGPNILPVYLSIQNPLIYDQRGKGYRETTYADLLQQAKDEGRDGLIIKNTKDGGPSVNVFTLLARMLTGRPVFQDTIIVAFRPEQIKSAIGNNGNFDPADARITKSEKRNLTDTPEFKRWWGDDNTMVDASGAPRVLYHGTTKVNERRIDNFKRSTYGAMGPAVYLGDSPEASAGYDQGALMKVYARGKYLTNAQWTKYVNDHGWSGAEAAATADGWAGVYDEKFENAVAVWDPANIKSADKNDGSFDEGEGIRSSEKRSGDAVYEEIAGDEEMIAALETYMAVGDPPEGALNDRLVAYMRRLPPVPADSYLTFYRNQPRWAKPWIRGWSSWTINQDQTRFFGGRDFEVLTRKGVQGLDLGRLGEQRSKLTGEYYEYGSQGEWLVLNDSVFGPKADVKFSEKRKPGQLDDVEAYHFSKGPRKELISAMYGTGLKGSGADEYKNATDERRRHRIYFYFDKGTGIKPEAGVGGAAHKATLNNVYDVNADPLKLKAGTQAKTETNILDAGFDGYLDRLEGTQSGQIIMLGQRAISVQALPPGTRVVSGKVVPGDDSQPVNPWKSYATGLSKDDAEATLARLQSKPGWAAYELEVAPAGEKYQVRMRAKEGVVASQKRSVLNVGLSTAEVAGEGQITEDVVRAAVERLGVRVTALQVRQSNTEPTAIVTIDRPLTQDEGDELSRELQQEAIAQRYNDGTGDLFGPKADEWGPFNPEYFLDAEEEAVAASAKRVDEFEMSTRTPYAKRGVTEDGKASLLVSDFAASKGQENWTSAVAELVTKYPNYRDAKSADTPERQLERMIRQMTDNLLWLHDQVPAGTRNRSKLWYDGARAIVDRWVRKYELTPHQAAGLLAVLSPQKDWYMNVSLAERVAQVLNERQAFRWSKQMTETAARIFGGAAYQEDVEAIKGQTLEDLESDYLRAMWLRVYDEAHNSRSFMIVGPEGDVLAEARTKDGSPAKVAWGGISTIAKAVSIFNDGSFDNISKELGRKHKVRNFYNNILVPNSPNGHVTIDTHAVAAALLRALSGNAIEVKHNFGGPSSAQAGLQGSYALYEEAYRRAAEERDLLPREMQSITWEAVRGLFVPTFKSQASNVRAVDGAWNQFKKGRLSYENTRDFVSELAGGIEPPSWLGRDPGAYAEDESAADEGDVSGDGVPERDAEPVDGGAGGRDSGAAAQGLIASAKRAPFYSALQKSVEGLSTKAAPAAGWRDAIKGLVAKGQVKQDEVEWSGVNEWLALQGAKVTREQVVDYLKSNGVQVEETTLGGKRLNGRELEDKLFAWAEGRDGNTAMLIEAGEPWDQVRRSAEKYGDQDVLDLLDQNAVASKGSRDTKYGGYTLPGGENYREVLLTLPLSERNAKGTAEAKRLMDQADDLDRQSMAAWQRTGDPAEFQRLNNEARELRRRATAAEKAGDDATFKYQSNHWDQPNVLAHIRLNDRTDADGKRVLFVEEIQSDWAQEGKKEGFKGDLIPQDTAWRATDTLNSFDTREEAEEEARNLSRNQISYRDPDVQYRLVVRENQGYFDVVEESRSAVEYAPNRGGAPRAPFVDKTDKWVNLALKRVIKMAVDEGYDRVAFVNGDQSAERYDLSKQIESIRWAKAPKGYTIVAFQGGKEVTRKDSLSPDELEDVVGKEIAKKIVDGVGAEQMHDTAAELLYGRGNIGLLRGLDLKVGGEGMKAFYDKIVPAAVKDVLKKLGGEKLIEVPLILEKSRMDELSPEDRMEAAQEFAFDPDAMAQLQAPMQEMTWQNGFDVTDKMREKAGPGLPLFSAKRDLVGDTGTEKFKNWFRESKLVDKDGEPLMMYHGTQAKNITVFKRSEDGAIGPGIYLTQSMDAAGGYAGEGGTVEMLYARMENPLVVYNGADLPALQIARDDKFWKENFYTRGAARKWAEQQIEDWAGIQDPEFLTMLRDAGYDGVILKDPKTDEIVEAMVPSAYQVKSALNEGNWDGFNADIYTSAKRVFADSGRQYTPEQLKAFSNTGRVVEERSLVERLQLLTDNWKKKLAQGLVDQFAPIKDLGAPGKAAYALARLSKGSSGAIEAFLHHGKLKVTTDGVYDADRSGGAIERLFAPLGGETADFLSYVAANRAERLLAEDREKLFTPADIAALKTLDQGTTRFDYVLQHGARAGQVTRDRTLIYADALKTFNEFNKNALDIAEQSGLIDKDTRPFWEHEFYVPFYRQSDDGSFSGASIKDGLVRQKAFERLKGGTSQLKSDMLDNVLQNWAHLIDASAKNRAALATIDAAQQLSVAYSVAPQTKGSVWVMRNGQAEHYAVEDPYTLAAISSISYSGLKGFGWDMLTAPKRWLTIGVTASPAFKVRNLIRDSVQAIGVSELSPNILANIKQGWKASDKDSQTFVSALAGGGLIRFGTMLEGRQADRVRQLVKQARRDAHMLDSESKIRKLYDLYLEPAVAAYNEIGNRSEEVNRSALYDQLIKKGVSPAEANLAARDLMDFSMMGAWGAVRFLTQVVPFLNARIQGLYKLGRGAAEHKAKFGILLGAVALASITLMAAYSDDDWWKKREDWDRNTNWAFKIGDVVYRIPKPFEIGAIATLAERGIEFAFNPDMTGKRYARNVRDLVMDNLAMNPVPQAVKPIIDLYANYDSFTSRPIENLAMQRLRPEYRMTANTTMTARALSTAGNAAANTIGAKFLSPVQVDHLIDGYFAWLGSFAMFVPELIAREATGQPTRPARDWYKFLSQGMAQEVTSGSSYYVSALYKQAEEVERAYATWRQLQKEGKNAEAMEFFTDHRDEIVKYRSVNKVKDGEAKFTEMIRMIERSTKMGADEKKARIIQIRQMQDTLARTLTAAR